VGYTNAGKSTLFNRLTGADVLAADMPFATLDPTAREVTAASGRRFALIDTVGFITDLPTHLVAAFRATLEEAMEADLLVHVRDIAHEDSEHQANDVYAILEQLAQETGADRPPIIEAWNKADAVAPAVRSVLSTSASGHSPPALLISAMSGDGVDGLLQTIERELYASRRPRQVLIVAADGRARSWLHDNVEVLSETMADEINLAVEAAMSDIDVSRFISAFPDARVR
jgi:GTPase